jgi:hypothetical protein
MRSFGRYSVTENMPAPTGFWSRSGFSNAAGLIIIPGRSESTSGSWAPLPPRFSVTVSGSTTSTDVITARSDATAEPSTVWPRSMLAFTASASKGVPSWNVTPSRSVNVRAVPSSLNSHAVANPGIADASGALCTRRS